jgi:hypothetical protein
MTNLGLWRKDSSFKGSNFTECVWEVSEQESNRKCAVNCIVGVSMNS